MVTTHEGSRKEADESTVFCPHCEKPLGIATAGSADTILQRMKRWSWSNIVAAGLIISIFISITAIAIPAYRDHTARSKIYRVVSLLDPIKLDVARAYRDKGRIPAMHTIVTAANQGKPATPDWAALGFELMPTLPPQVKRLEFSAQDNPEIVVELDKIDKTIDGTTIRAKLNVTGKKLFWQHEATSSDPRVQQIVPHLDGPGPSLDAPAREEGCR